MKNRVAFILLVAIVTIVGASLHSCKKEENLYFKGEIITVDKFDKEITLEGTKIELDDIYDGQPFICDSFLVFDTSQCPDYYFYAFDLKSGKHVASFCPKGNGPDDYLSCIESVQLMKENGDSKIWIRDYNKQEIHLINITQSIAQQRTVCDSITPYEWSKYFEYPLPGVFFLENGEILGISQCEDSNFTVKEYTPRDLYLFKGSFDNRTREYHLYKRPVILEDTRVDFECSTFYNAAYRVKPDNTQLAIAMKLLAQISIVDIKTGEQKNYRLKESLTFEDIGKDVYKSRRYYNTMAVGDKYIFALYINLAMKEFSPPYSSHVIHVFTWDGRPAYEIYVNESINYMALDAVNHILYATDVEDNIYSYDVSEL